MAKTGGVEMNKRTWVVPTTRLLFFINAGLWLILAATSILHMTQEYPGQMAMYTIIGVLMVGNAFAMFLSGWGLVCYPWLFYPLGLVVLLVNIPLTLTDEFGFFDLVTLVIDLALLALLVTQRKKFYQ
jgi:hypothetical protein